MVVAPVPAGLLMLRSSPRGLVVGGLLGLMFTEAAFYLAPTLPLLSGLRFLQGGLIALLVAALMTYIALNAVDVRRVMAYYVAASILGGLGGRVLAGFLASEEAWRPVFLVLTVGLAGCVGLAWRMEAGPAPRSARLFGALGAVLRQPLVRRASGVGFAGFFVFTALLNFLPFRLQDLDPAVGQASVGLSYAGFLVGVAAALLSARLRTGLGGTFPAIYAGLAVLLGAVALAAVPALGALFAISALAAPGFFLVHTLLAGALNARAGTEAGAVNAVYVASYYIGGSLGSYVPGLVYAAYGWGAFLALLSVVGGLAVYLTHRSALAVRAQPTPAAS